MRIPDCDICADTGYDFLGRPCRRCNPEKPPKKPKK